MFEAQRVMCPNCSAAVKRKRFCDECGAPLADAQAAQAPAPAPNPDAAGHPERRAQSGDGQVRLDSSKMPDNLQAYAEISGMLHAAATQEARRYGE